MLWSHVCGVHAKEDELHRKRAHVSWTCWEWVGGFMAPPGNNCSKNQTLLIHGGIYFLLLRVLLILRQEIRLNFTQYAAISQQPNVSKDIESVLNPPTPPQKSDVMQKTRVVLLNPSLFLSVRQDLEERSEWDLAVCLTLPPSSSLTLKSSVKFYYQCLQSLDELKLARLTWLSLDVHGGGGGVSFALKGTAPQIFPGVFLVLEGPLLYLCALGKGQQKEQLPFCKSPKSPNFRPTKPPG